jgi:hypothetical protein
VFSRPSLEYQRRNHTKVGSKKTYCAYEKPNGLSLSVSGSRIFPQNWDISRIFSLGGSYIESEQEQRGNNPKRRCVHTDAVLHEHNIFYVTDGNIMYLTDASRFLISCVIQHYAPVVGWRNRCIMLIMSLDPSWKQTLSLPPTGIEPGSPASQAGFLPKELSRQLIPVLRIRDVCPRSRILIFSHPGSGSKTAPKRGVKKN